MQSGQNQFFNFILERTKSGREQEIISALQESFALQNSNNFTKEKMEEVSNKILDCLKPEHVEEVSNIMKQFGSQHISK